LYERARSRGWQKEGAATIDLIVVHFAQGGYSGTLGWFRNRDNPGSSAHYTVSKYGMVGQSLRDQHVAGTPAGRQPTSEAWAWSTQATSIITA
jgi:hypothetical protein